MCVSETQATSSKLQLSSARVGADVHDEEARAERAAAKVAEAADELKGLEKKVEAKLAAKMQVGKALARCGQLNSAGTDVS